MEEQNEVFHMPVTIEEIQKRTSCIPAYVSCIKIKGKPILPPLMTEERRKEMGQLRRQAMEVAARQRERRAAKAADMERMERMGDIERDLRGVAPSHQSTPARPMSLSLRPQHRSQTFVVEAPDSTVCRATLEQRLALEENGAPFRSRKTKQSPILEEYNTEEPAETSLGESEARRGDRRRWSPLEVDSLKELRVQLAEGGDAGDTSATVTPSPRLVRQASYTLLTPSPALLSYLETQDRGEHAARPSSRKTWDLTSARRRWDPSSQMSKSMDEGCGAERPHAGLAWGCSSLDSVVVGQEATEAEPAARCVEEDMTTSLSSASSRHPASPRARVRCKMKRPRARPREVPATEVPSPELAELLLRLRVEHERQKRELEERQRLEQTQLELLFRQRRTPQPPHTPQPRPHSARDSHDPAHHCRPLYQFFNGRSRSVDFARALAGQDTDLDVSFCDESSRTREAYSRLETDSASNMSSRSSTLSSEGTTTLPRAEFLIPPGEAAKYNQAATVITAAAKGYLTRRLLRTAHVQSLITTVRDAVSCATQLHSAKDLAESDMDLMKRLARQIEAAWHAVYSVFFETELGEQLQLIGADRERVRASSMRASSSDRDPRPARLSAATEKTLRRKRGGGSAPQGGKGGKGASRRSCSKLQAAAAAAHSRTPPKHRVK